MVESIPDAQETTETQDNQDSSQPNRRVYKKVVRPKTNAETESACPNEEVLLVRVRRRAEAEPLEALELDFDQNTN